MRRAWNKEPETKYSTLESLRFALEQADDAHGVDINLDGGCPCFYVEAGNTVFDGHCWRVCLDCEHCGFHVTGTDKREEQEVVAALLKSKLDAMNWYGDWELHWTPRA